MIAARLGLGSLVTGGCEDPGSRVTPAPTSGGHAPTQIFKTTFFVCQCLETVSPECKWK